MRQLDDREKGGGNRHGGQLHDIGASSKLLQEHKRYCRCIDSSLNT